MTQQQAPAPKTGWLTSEFSTLLGAWLGVQAMPEHLVWPTVVVACVYMVTRGMTKVAHARGPAYWLDGESEAKPTGEHVAPAPAEPMGFAAAPAPQSAGRAAVGGLFRGLGLAAITWAVLAAPGCQSLGEVLAKPLPQQEVTVETPDGQVVTGAPVATDPAPVDIELPEGAGEITYTPPAATEGPTVGSAIGEAAGTVVGVVTGNPALGAVLSLVLAGLLGRAKKR